MTAPAVLTVEQLEELTKLTAASVRPNGHVDLCYCNGCKRANAASEKLVEKLDPALPALLETARAYHRLTSALETLGFTRPDEMIQQARDRGWKDPQ